MQDGKKQCKIKISKDGPYIISGDVPLSEKIITQKGKGYEFKDGREIPNAEGYALCRCGKSKNSPFCDGSHNEAHFDGTENASRDKYSGNADKIEGPNLGLLDDVSLCAFARFCHRQQGNVWDLTRNSNNIENREEAIKAASDCPSGRLVAVDKTGETIEPLYEPSIEILQDPQNGVSGPIFVKGGIPIEASDGYVYEMRNRVTLCRCGESKNKPFCDAAHISAEYSDHK